MAYESMADDANPLLPQNEHASSSGGVPSLGITGTTLSSKTTDPNAPAAEEAEIPGLRFLDELEASRKRK